jgi:hypothetical protein
LSRQRREPVSTAQPREAANVGDPRLGDIEDDASSTKRRSLLSLAGSLFAEISPAKLILSWTMLFVVPAFLLGLTPLIASAWLMLVRDKIASPLIGVWPLLMLALLATVALAGARSVLRMAESNFWSLNSLAIEPVYAICREGIRHLAGRFFDLRADPSRSARFSAVASLIAGLLMSGAAAYVAWLTWPASRWLVTIADLASPQTLLPIALANGVVLVASYLAIAALVWSYADAAMRLPRDLHPPAVNPQVRRKWRVAHLSDLHTVGERYGFRIESGRSGPSGNDRLRRILLCLEQAHRSQPIDVILITGDLTDAGRSAEWSELLSELQSHPRLLERILVVPGNHDLNVVDRSNPAKLDLPLSPHRRLRRLRLLSAVDLIQGDRVRVVDRTARRMGESLSALVRVHRAEMARFSDTARPLFTRGLDGLWATAFPMIAPPDPPDGLGVILLNSNADTHFSFTNALGMITSDQLQGIEIAIAQYPQACWIVALHHHVVEYPEYATVLSERVGTALVNGSWFVRRLHKLAEQAVLMHGHRHIDWIGECAGLRIVSAPSQVMEATNGEETCFHIHTLAVTHDGRLCLTGSDRIAVEGDASR